MPGNFETRSQEINSLKESVREYVKTSELFGEDEFFRTLHQTPLVEKPAQESSDKKARLDALYGKYAECKNCPLGNTRNKIVFGMGVLNPDVLFVGEGPGFEEDRKGLPFVGRAGELLDKIMASINLSREKSVYIANIVKCHPMKNPDRPDLRGNDRPPEPSEMAACLPILEEQIDILDPKFICTLGSVSTKALLKTEDGISRIRGRLFEYVSLSHKKIQVLPTYHPAALLRNPELKRDVWEDMKLLQNLISQTL